LAALSPVSAADQEFDARLRSSLGAPDVSDLIVISAADTESALSAAENCGRTSSMVWCSPVSSPVLTPRPAICPVSLCSASGATRYRPARCCGPGCAQHWWVFPYGRRASSPSSRLSSEPAGIRLVDRSGLAGTSLASGGDALLAQRGNRVVATAAAARTGRGPPPFAIDAAHVNAALGVAPPGVSIALLDLKHESDALYAAYQAEAIRLSLLGFGVIVLLLLLTLRSVVRVLRVIAPLILAVLVVTPHWSRAGRR